MAYRMTDSLSTRTVAVSAAVAHRCIRGKQFLPARCAVVPNAIELRSMCPISGGAQR